MYDALLNPTTRHAYKPNSMRMAASSSAVKLLDCKQFVKNYSDATSKMMPSNPFSLSIRWFWDEIFIFLMKNM
jgi:hypothetical protein